MWGKRSEREDEKLRPSEPGSRAMLGTKTHTASVHLKLEGGGGGGGVVGAGNGAETEGMENTW